MDSAFKGQSMSDALSEALIKLAAGKPVAESSLPSPEPLVATPDPQQLAAETRQASSRQELQQRSAEIAEPRLPPAAAAASEYTAAAQPATIPVPMTAAATASEWLVRIRELRGWVAAGIVLAILFTVIDDLRRHGQARTSTEIAASAAADVNLDELLREFETAEPSSGLQGNRAPERNQERDQEQEPVVPDTESAVTASYGDIRMESADESAVSGAGAGVVRFSGRIEPLR